MKTSCIYARVSSDRQEQEDTVQSQLAELRTRVNEDRTPPCEEFVDEAYARDNLMRPGLDRLRDLVVQGDIDRIYIQSPDRLASGAKLIILVEEFQDNGVEVIFLKGSVDETPEGKLLLHMQGAIAEYERTKIAERTRRGKLYWAKQGAMVGGHAPYGYHFIRRTDTDRAKLEIDEFKAAVVRRMYRLLVEDQLSTRSIAKTLTNEAIPTARGANQWQPTAVDRILKNPVYKGQFLYCRTESVLPSRRLTQDPYKQSRKTGRKVRPEEEWIIIPVPAIVDESLWDQAQEQLKQNSIHSKRNNRRHPYLLRGLIRCPRCGSTYSGHAADGIRRYRCTLTDSSVSSTGRRCRPGSFKAEPVEQAVWGAVAEALEQPHVLIAEYERRLSDLGTVDVIEQERKQLSLALKRLAIREDRVTEAYVNEVMELDRYKNEMEKLMKQRSGLEELENQLGRRAKEEQDAKSGLRYLEEFCDRVSKGLESLSFEDRQKLLRLVVQRITVEDNRVRIETIIPPDQDVLLRTRRPERVEDQGVVGAHLGSIGQDACVFGHRNIVARRLQEALQDGSGLLVGVPSPGNRQ